MHRFTVDEYERIILAETLKDPGRVELLNGYVVGKMAKTPQHGYSTRKVLDALGGGPDWPRSDMALGAACPLVPLLTRDLDDLRQQLTMMFPEPGFEFAQARARQEIPRMTIRRWPNMAGQVIRVITVIMLLCEIGVLCLYFGGMSLLMLLGPVFKRPDFLLGWLIHVAVAILCFVSFVGVIFCFSGAILHKHSSSGY